MRKFRTLGMTLLMVSLLLAGCGQNAAPKEGEPQTIKVGEVTHSVFYAPQYVAMSEGYFADEGLSVDLLNLQGADKVMSALISNEIQVGLMGPEASIYVANQNLEDYAINFAQLTQRDGSFLLSRQPEPDFKFGELQNAEILGGRIGGVPEMTLEYVLKTNGLDIGVDDAAKSVNVRTDIQFSAMAGAFVAGEGDYVSLFEPTATALEKEGKGYIVASIGEQSGAIPYTAYSASKSYMNANPEVIQHFTNAICRGQQYVQTHSAEEIAQAIHPYFTDIELEDLVVVVDRYKSIDAWNHDPVFGQPGFEKLMDVMALAGQLDQRADYATIVNTEFAENAVQLEQ